MIAAAKRVEASCIGIDPRAFSSFLWRFATMENGLDDRTTDGDAQVACNLTPTEGADLRTYAEGLELSRRRLCGLLIVRELRLNRIGELSARHPGSGSRRNSSRVTARVSASTKASFAKHVKAAIVGSDDAAAAIFRAELEEKWLSNAVSGEGNRG